MAGTDAEHDGDEDFSIFRPPGSTQAAATDDSVHGGHDELGAGDSLQHHPHLESPTPLKAVADPAQQQQQQQPVQPGATAAADPAPEEQLPALSPEEFARMLATAEGLKAEGNALYGEGKLEEAAEKYAEALEAAPPAAHKQRAVYLANMAACDVGRQQYKEAVQACTAALEEDPSYIKAYMRRGVAHKALDDLDAALTDARKVLELDPSSAWAARTVKELEPIVAERHEKLKTEMLGKLKDLGNMVLGKFGLSVDNFKATKDPNTGGYSISFQQ